MALRVLLADESTTIKKVIQLALQDYAVQVRSVTIGTEALEVAKQFKPDLVLADVLLPKKSGYEVCAEVKSDPTMKDVPVILMWSGFMEVDETQFSSARANDRIEKPFNVDTLRALVQKWVPKTKEQALAKFLHFPTTITEMEAQPTRLTQTGEPTTSLDPVPSILDAEPTADEGPESAGPATPENPANLMDDEKTVDWDMDSFEDINAFVSTDHLIQKTAAKPPQPVGAKATPPLVPPASSPTPKAPNPAPPKPTASVTPQPAKPAMPQMAAVPPEDDFGGLDLQALNQAPVDVASILTQQEALQRTHPIKSTTPPTTTPISRTASAKMPPTHSELPPTPQIPQLSAQQLEELIRAQSREIIEAVVWKIVPEMAGQMIREELERLMAEE